jgi:predicted permease
MQAILAVTLPFFALVLAGWLAARRGLLPEAAVPGLNAYVLYFALPCLLMRFGMNTPVLQLLNPAVLAVYLLCALMVVALTIAVSLNPRVGLKDAAFGALVAAFPNTGFMGVPLLVALLGPAAAGPLICTILADLFVTSSVCIALSQLRLQRADLRLERQRARLLLPHKRLVLLCQALQLLPKPAQLLVLVCRNALLSPHVLNA